MRKTEQIASAETPQKPSPTKSTAKKPAEKAPAPESAPRVAQTQEDIEKEAARIRAEREELERIKKAEGERLAKIPPKPRQHPTAEEMHALAMAEMNRMQQEMAAMMNAMPMRGGFGPMPPLARGGIAVPGLPPEFERQIQEMERRQEEFFRQTEARMRAQRNAFGPNRRPAAPPNGNRQPDVRTFRFSSPDGRIQGFQMRMESLDGDLGPL